jgi:restriction system protein
MGFNVTLTPKSHDYGADLILKTGNRTIVVQSKLYHNHSIGISSVQEVYSSIKYYNADLGIVVTNSKFSRNSVNLANSTNILLWDKDMLIRLLNFKDYEKKIFRNQLLCSMASIK